MRSNAARNLSVYKCTVNWFCVHMYCKLVLGKNVLSTGYVHTCTLMDITSKRNVQGTYTQNQFTKQVFIKPLYSTCIHTKYTKTTIRENKHKQFNNVFSV